MPARSLQQLPRLLRTMSHLQPSQVGWRLRYLVQRRLEAQRWYRFPEGTSARWDEAQLEPPRPHLAVKPAPAPPKLDRLTELARHRLTLLNEQRPFRGGSEWLTLGEQDHHRLWNFSLHYHAWLRDLAVAYAATGEAVYLTELRRWLIDWLEHCPLGAPEFSRFAWNSFNIGERLLHWREIDALVPASFWNDFALPRERFLHSVHQQADYLSRHIEWDLRGNHLFKDAVGLAAAADLLGNAAPPHWRTLATNIAVSQMEEQILPDGMHFERSPMYHQHVLQDMLTLSELLHEAEAVEALRATCRRMAAPVRWLQHPDGRFPLFNDAAVMDVQPADVEADLIKREIISPRPAPSGFRNFDCAGIVAWRGNPWTLFWDVGVVGPSYQPGHAHADTLTLELSFAGLPLVVDPGVYSYDKDDRRRYDRSTGAHNTVCIDDIDSSEVWHIFRVGRRAHPRDVSLNLFDSGFSGHASHTGYEQLPGSPHHARHILLDRGEPLEIVDEITGEGTHRVEGGFLLSPEWTAEQTSSGWILSQAKTRLRINLHSNRPVQLSIAQRPWHPEFGREIETRRLVWSGIVELPFRLQTIWQRDRW